MPVCDVWVGKRPAVPPAKPGSSDEVPGTVLPNSFLLFASTAISYRAANVPEPQCLLFVCAEALGAVGFGASPSIARDEKVTTS